LGLLRSTILSKARGPEKYKKQRKAIKKQNEAKRGGRHKKLICGQLMP